MNDITHREEVFKEIHYRREKQWAIFIWTTNLILAAIAGFVTLSSSDYFQLTIGHSIAISVSILLLALYSIRWINNNIKLEKNAIKLLVL